MNSTVSAELAGSPESARAARALIRQALGDKHPSADDAQLIVTELVSNAIAHSRSGQPGGTLTVEVSNRAPEVLICVNDAGADETPAVTAVGSESEHGRGLRIVDALATEWGTASGPDGRTTWCRLIAADLLAQPAQKDPASMRKNPEPEPENDPYNGHPYNGGKGTFFCVVQINEQLRGRTQPNGLPIEDMWPEALHRSWDALAEREAEDREAEP
jgi:anti-sigma regulatory factor (Ser/Thr protein kinase)